MTVEHPAPVTAEFLELVNRNGPFKLAEETRPIGTESRTQGVRFRVRNNGARTAGVFDFHIQYFDAAGNALPIQTRQGPMDHDRSRLFGISQVIAPGESKNIRFDPNHGPIPPSAERASIRFTQICELDYSSNGIAVGACWWPE